MNDRALTNHGGPPAGIEAVFATLSERRVSALLVNTDPFFLARGPYSRGSNPAA
jgi:hypothetical protein